MKKILVSLSIIMSLFMVMGCSSKDEPVEAPSDVSVQEQQNKESNSYIDQEELKRQIEEEAVQGDFVAINGDEMYGKSVFVTGTISLLDKESVLPTFTLSSEENGGFGIYEIIVVEKDILDSLSDGMEITVYGKVMDKNKVGIPRISGKIIKE